MRRLLPRNTRAAFAMFFQAAGAFSEGESRKMHGKNCQKGGNFNMLHQKQGAFLPIYDRNVKVLCNFREVLDRGGLHVIM